MNKARITLSILAPLLLANCANTIMRDQELMLARTPTTQIEKWRIVQAKIEPVAMPQVFTSLDDVNRYANAFNYETDQELYGVPEHWATPQEMMTHHAGDCEDFAILKYQLIKQSRLANSEDMRFILLRDNFHGGVGHIVLAVNDKILDSQNANIVPLRSSTFLGRYSLLAFIPTNIHKDSHDRTITTATASND